MNTKFDQIFLETVATLDPVALKNKLGPLGRMLGPKEKEGLQAALEPLTDVTETDPNEDLIKKLEEMDFDRMDTTSKENLIKALINKGINIQTDGKTEKPQEKNNTGGQDSLTYSAPTPNF